MIRILGLCLALLLVGCATKGPGDSSVPPEGPEVIASKAQFVEDLPSELVNLLSQAKQLADDKAFDQAIGVLESAKVKYASYPHLDLNAALVKIKEKEYSDALVYVEQALAVRENYPPTFNVKGVVHRLVGDFSDAKAAYEHALSIAPNYTNAWLNLGILADLYLRDYPLALSSFEEYLKYESGDEKVKNWVVELKRRMPQAEAE